MMWKSPPRQALAWVVAGALAGCVAAGPPQTAAPDGERPWLRAAVPAVRIVGSPDGLGVAAEAPRPAPGAPASVFQAGKGRILVNVKWPGRSTQAIPDDAESIMISALQGQVELGSVVIARPASTGQLFLDEAAGLTVIARAYATATPSVSDEALAQGAATGVAVTAGQDTPVSITLGPVPAPVIASITPDNAGPGAQVQIAGSNLGADTGEPFSLLLTGGSGTFDLMTTAFPTRMASGSTHYISFTVPGSGDGNRIEVVVGGKKATASFDILASLQISPQSATVGIGGTRAFTAAATASDGVTALASPALQWSLIGPPDFEGNLFDIADIGLTSGEATGVGAGTVWVRASSGNLSATASLSVQ